MGIVGVIPARWAAKRLPGKSLVDICGKPLIVWVWEAASRARNLERVLVATDDERIRDTIRGVGGEAVMTKPDHPSGTDRVAEAVRDTDAGVVINIQGDEPLMDPALIERLGDLMESEREWDMATAAVPLRDPEEVVAPSVVKVVRAKSGRALYFSRSVIPHVRDSGSLEAAEFDRVRQAMSEGGLFWRHVGVYAYRREFLGRLVSEPPCALERAERLEQLRALHIGATIAVIETDHAGLGVDTPEDVKKAGEALRQRVLVKGS